MSVPPPSRPPLLTPFLARALMLAAAVLFLTAAVFVITRWYVASMESSFRAEQQAFLAAMPAVGETPTPFAREFGTPTRFRGAQVPWRPVPGEQGVWSADLSRIGTPAMLRLTECADCSAPTAEDVSTASSAALELSGPGFRLRVTAGPERGDLVRRIAQDLTLGRYPVPGDGGS